jgi:hypothetical protein
VKDPFNFFLWIASLMDPARITIPAEPEPEWHFKKFGSSYTGTRLNFTAMG